MCYFAPVEVELVGQDRARHRPRQLKGRICRKARRIDRVCVLIGAAHEAHGEPHRRAADVRGARMPGQAVVGQEFIAGRVERQRDTREHAGLLGDVGGEAFANVAGCLYE